MVLVVHTILRASATRTKKRETCCQLRGRDLCDGRGSGMCQWVRDTGGLRHGQSEVKLQLLLSKFSHRCEQAARSCASSSSCLAKALLSRPVTLQATHRPSAGEHDHLSVQSVGLRNVPHERALLPKQTDLQDRAQHP